MTALELTSEKEASAEMLEAAAGRVGKAKRFYADFELGDFVDAPDGALTYFHEVERRDARIAALQAENERLRAELKSDEDARAAYDLIEGSSSRPTERTVTEADPLDQVELLFLSARVEADKAMRKFPQPNYVISKVAEEAGEVVKAAIHCAEGRETPENVVAEIRQAMAMLIRLYVEGDQVHGLPALAQEAK